MNTLQTSSTIAIVSFTLGTILFLLQLVSVDNHNLPLLGFYYVCIAIVVNLIVLLALAVKLFIVKQKVAILKSMAIIVINAPIAYAYAYILFEYSFI